MRAATAPNKYTSKDRTISRSTHHKDMWIVSYPDGTFFAISTSDEGILSSNPPDTRTVVRKPFKRVVPQLI